MARTEAKGPDKQLSETSPASAGIDERAHAMLPNDHSTESNSGPITASSQRARRRGMKGVLLACGVVAVGGAVALDWQAVELASRPVVKKVEGVSGPVMQKIEDISGPVVQKAEDVFAAAVQKAEDVSAVAVQKIEDISATAAQKVEIASVAAVQMVKEVSGAVGQKVSAAIDSWQEYPAQATAKPSPENVQTTGRPSIQATAERPSVILRAPDTSSGGLIERSVLPTGVQAGSRFGIGDRLKIAFYERVDVEEDKWGSASSASALRGILQRPELSGEYVVQEDGTISVPLLGSIAVANRSTQQVQASLVETFGQLLGRPGLVNILALERPPVYVLGPVKNPGSFKYAPGMTIMHALALAGGLDQGQSEPWQKIEAVRETHKRSGTIDAMLKLLAREAVLMSERDGTAPKVPRRLLELVSATEAADLVNEQSDLRKAVADVRKERERATQRAVEEAKQEVVAYGRMDSLDDLVRLRQERVKSMRTLVDRKLLDTTMMDQVQSELSDAQQRRQDALNRYEMAKQRLASLDSEALQIRADLRNELETEIETTESQISDNLRELNTSENVLNTLGMTDGQHAKNTNSVTYQIVRQSASGPVCIESIGMTLLQPGDLVNVVVGESEARESFGSSVPSSSPPREDLQGACTANDVEPARAAAEQKASPN